MLHLHPLRSTAQLLLTILTATHSLVMAASLDNLNSDPCSALLHLLPGKVSYPSDAAYITSDKSYFFQQARLSPKCIVRPTSAQDVCLIVKNLAQTGAKAAVRGGGHTPFAGAANIENAVTIDLSGMNTVTLNTGREFDILQPGSPNSSSLDSSGSPCLLSSKRSKNASSDTL